MKRYPDNTVAVARALHKLRIPPTVIARLIHVPKEAICYWTHQGGRRGVGVDRIVYHGVRSLVARAKR